MNKSIVLFSGYNQRAIISFLRTLVSNNINYGIVASSKNDLIFLTSYSNNVLAVRKKKELDLNDIMRCLVIVKENLRSDKYIIAPSTEALNRFLLDNRKDIENKGFEIPLVDKEIYESISDKYSFNQLCKKAGILVPEIYSGLSSIKLPYVAKPKKYKTADGNIYNPIIIFDEKSHNSFTKKYNIRDFYLQKFINGKSFYLLYYFYKDGSLLKYSQQNYIQQTDGKSIIAAESSDFHNTEESLRYENLFKKLNFRGFVMIEVRQDNNLNYMIEANPRFWGPSQLFVDAGINFFESFLFDFGVIDKKPIPKKIKKVKYFWFGGLIQSLVNKSNIVYHAYNSEQTAINLSEWISNDIYNREDTRELFKFEIKI